MYVLEKNIPIPTKSSHGRPKGALRTAIEAMSKGDSFFVEDNSKRNSASTIGRTLGIEIVTRAQDHGFRVWRVK